MMKCPTIYVVIDGGCRDIAVVDPQAWFFDEDEATKWAEENQPEGHYWQVHSVPPPELAIGDQS